MFNQKRLEKLRQLATKIEQKRVLKTEKLSHRSNQPQLGDIFVFDTPETVGLQWVVLKPHPDNEQLLFTIPADDNPMVGSTDIALSENAICGPLTLRCSNGVWIHKTDFDMSGRVGLVEKWDLQCALEQVKQISNGTLQTTIWQTENDVDPNYEEWMSEVVIRGQIALENAIQELSAEQIASRDVIQLTDFELIKKSQEGLIFAWSFDRQRQLCLELSMTDSTAKLIQSYNNGQNWKGDVLWPIIFNNQRLEFIKANASQSVCQLTPELVREIAQAFNLSEFYQNWAISKPVRKPISLLEKFASSLKQSFDLQPISPLAQPLGEEPEKTSYYQIDNLKLGIFGTDEDDIIQLKLNWLGNQQVNIILFEDDEPVQKEMQTKAAEFFFDPSQAHVIVVQNATGTELYRLPLNEIE